MKLLSAALFLLLLLTSCKKEDTEISIVGKWMLSSYGDDAGGYRAYNNPLNFIRFKPNGEFQMDNQSPEYFVYKRVCEGFTRYKRISGELIRLYKPNSSETLDIYLVDKKILLGFRFESEVFVKH